jgi:aminoglycoside phosphotransferase (APT) family kinase protein
MRRAADTRAGTVIAARAERWERTLAELHRIDSRVARNGNSSGVSNDMHDADLARAKRRAALAEREAALWRATAEVLRLDRDIRREQAQRAGVMAQNVER